MDRRRSIVRAGALLVALLAAGLWAAPAALAQDGGTTAGNTQVVFDGKLDVPAGQTVESAVIFNGPATVEGTVQKSLVVFNGSAVISGTVNGDVVVFNGDVALRKGARVVGDVYAQDPPVVAPGATFEGQHKGISGGWNMRGFGFAGRFAWWVGFTVSTLVLGLILLGIAPAADAAIARTTRQRTGASIGFGALAFFLLPIVAIVLMVLLVTLPLGLFLLLALPLVYTVGYVAAAHALGRLLVKPPASRFLAFLAGIGILRVAALIPVLGGLTWLAASIFGLGVLWMAARPAREPSPAEVAPPPPPPVPAPS
ncbi:MAG TPA: polymer-forming cytoskeletal protein [Actinomycetota bacterium]|nr:polymer-forming cytoskeletal protein [Actinomycetota bacterium]